jgi:hypothetical protein
MWSFRKKQKDDDLDKKRLKAFGPLAVVSSLCIGPERLPVMHGVREEPKNVSDSGWMLASGTESEQFAADSNNFKLVPLDRMITADSTLAPLRDFPVRTEVTRSQVSEPWRFVVDDKVVDEDGKMLGEFGK